MQPANGFKFWSAIESAMERNIDELSAAEIVDLLLSFAYLGHYPEAESGIAKTVLFDGGKHLQHTEVRGQHAQNKSNGDAVADFIERLMGRKEELAKFQILRNCYQFEKNAQLSSKYATSDRRRC